MTAEPRVLRTEAEESLIRAFDESLSELPGGDAVAAARGAAFGRFRDTGLPHRRIEEWKYTDLRALMRTMAPIAPRPDAAAAKAALAAGADPLADVDRHRLVLVDGHFFDELSDREALLAEGVEVASTAELLARDAKVVLDTMPLAEGDVVLALNASFARDGVSLFVQEGAAPSKPVEIVHLTTGASSIFVRNSVLVSAGASLKLIETHHAPSGAQSNAATYLELGEGAKVSAVRLQAEDDEALHLSTLMTKLAGETELDHLTVTAGAGVSRSQAYVSIVGPGARLGLNGATMLSERRHADMTVVIDHAEPGSFSRVLTKNIVDGEATGAFQGKIIVEQDAQKTDGKMMNQSLHLSDDAWFASKPELEIYADDVQCGHGSTAGQIDETMLFYLLSRGIPRAEAEQLMITAFLAEAIETVGDETIAEALEAVAAEWLSHRGGLARAA